MSQSSVDCSFYEEFVVDGSTNTKCSSHQDISSKVGKISEKRKNGNSSKYSMEKKRITSITIQWLKENFCSSPDTCLPRDIVYEQYLHFCQRENISTACKATFGKLIRNTFSEVTSKRLGARGHSKYHYNGIEMKQKNEIPSLAEEITRFPSLASTYEENYKKFSISSKVGTLLPNFPDVEQLVIPDFVNKAKIQVFILMYKIHCQCIVDVAISGNFEEIQLFLLHFWQGFPEHLTPLNGIFLDLITVCDCIFYRTMKSVLIPPINFEMPEKLLRGIYSMAKHWISWMQCSLENMPHELVNAKMVLARNFSRTVKNCVTFMHLAQTIRPMLKSDVLLLRKELNEFQCESVLASSFSDKEDDMMLTQCKELLKILQNSASPYELMKYIDSIIYSKVLSCSDENQIRIFIFHWVFMLSKISYFLTEHQSKNFTTFHLLSSLIQEYILVAVEGDQDKELENRVHSRFKRHLKHKGSSGGISGVPSFQFTDSSIHFRDTTYDDHQRDLGLENTFNRIHFISSSYSDGVFDNASCNYGTLNKEMYE